MGASYEARGYGVRSAMPVHEAIQLCPQLTVVAPDGARYEGREAVKAVWGDMLATTPQDYRTRFS